MDELRKLVTCGDPWVENKAGLALELSDQYARNEISKSEYDELMLDLIRTDELDEESRTMETKNMLVSAVMGITSIT